MRVDRHCADPVERHEGECERQGEHGGVQQLRVLGEAEVGERQVEPVEHDEQQGPPEEAAHPQVDEADAEQVVEDEGVRELGGRGDELGGRVEVVEVGDLEDEGDDPAGLLVSMGGLGRGNGPVDGADDLVQGKGSVVFVISLRS